MNWKHIKSTDCRFFYILYIFVHFSRFSPIVWVLVEVLRSFRFRLRWRRYDIHRFHSFIFCVVARLSAGCWLRTLVWMYRNWPFASRTKIAGLVPRALSKLSAFVVFDLRWVVAVAAIATAAAAATTALISRDEWRTACTILLYIFIDANFVHINNNTMRIADCFTLLATKRAPEHPVTVHREHEQRLDCGESLAEASKHIDWNENSRSKKVRLDAIRIENRSKRFRDLATERSTETKTANFAELWLCVSRWLRIRKLQFYENRTRWRGVRAFTCDAPLMKSKSILKVLEHQLSRATHFFGEK